MDTTTDQIKREIEEARERISETTSQIGERIRSTFDWRQQVAEHPWAAVGVASAAGFLVGAAASRAVTRGRGRLPGGYAEARSRDRTSRDVEAQAEATSEDRAAGFGGAPSTGGEGRAAGDRLQRAGAATGGMMAGLAAALAPQLQEVGRNLADQLRDLSADLIAQGKEYVQQRVREWRTGSRAASGRGQRTGGTPSWPASGGTAGPSEPAAGWPAGSPAGAGTQAGAGPA